MKKFFSFFISRMFIVFALIGIQAWIIISLFLYFDDQSEVIRTVFWVISLVMALYIVNKRQNPSYKLAWIIVILVLPVFGVLMYIFFSQRQLTRRLRRITHGCAQYRRGSPAGLCFLFSTPSGPLDRGT